MVKFGNKIKRLLKKCDSPQSIKSSKKLVPQTQINQSEQIQFCDYKEFLAESMKENPTKAERSLRNLAKHFGFESQKVISPYIADLLHNKLKIIIELDGSSHNRKKDYDNRRDLFLKNLGYKVYRLSNRMALNDKKFLVDWFKSIVKDNNIVN